MAKVAVPLTSPETPTLAHAMATQSALWSAVSVVTLCGGVGLVMVALGDFSAVRGVPWAEALFWTGLLTIVLPFALRLSSADPSRSERIVLLMELGLALYLVKVIHSPVSFTFPDEFIHLRNLNEILESSHLFNTNGILPATPYYPGLEIVSSALVSLSGMSAFPAGLIVIGAARLVILLALFLVFEQLSGSARLAGIGAMLYMANPNYLFWSAQYSYESLSLPLAVAALFLLLRREQTEHRALAASFAVLSTFLVLAVIVTHHLTAYALIITLWTWAILHRLRGRKSKHGLGWMALFATFATLVWLVIVATPTVFYLAPVFRDAVIGVARFVGDPTSGRELFRSNTGYVAPLWERVAGIGSVLAILLLIPFGLLQLARGYWNKPLALLFGGTALVYPALLALRLTRTSWEIANRTSEFLFIGLGFVIALALVGSVSPEVWQGRLSILRNSMQRLGSPFVVASLVTLLLAGGIIAGWPPNGRMSHPFQAVVGNRLIYPQGITAADWMRANSDKDTRIAADYGNGRLLVSYGNQYPLTGSARGIRELLNARQVDSGVQEILKQNRVQYVLLDRRLLRDDPLVGIYFRENLNQSQLLGKYFDPSVYEKFDHQKGVNRVFDSGDIYIYDVEGLSGFTPTR